MTGELLIYRQMEMLLAHRRSSECIVLFLNESLMKASMEHMVEEVKLFKSQIVLASKVLVYDWVLLFFRPRTELTKVIAREESFLSPNKKQLFPKLPLPFPTLVPGRVVLNPQILFS